MARVAPEQPDNPPGPPCFPKNGYRKGLRKMDKQKPFMASSHVRLSELLEKDILPKFSEKECTKPFWGGDHLFFEKYLAKRLTKSNASLNFPETS